MSHIHIPDGVLPLWLVILGYVVIGIYLIFLSFYLKKSARNKKIALVGVMAALMLIAMTIEIIPPAYHINLAVLSGIILGPFLSVAAIFISNIILGFLGHGGISVIGLNTIVVAVEAVAGFWFFKFLCSRIKNIFITTFIAAFLALFISAWSSIGIIYLGVGNIQEIYHKHTHSTEVVNDHYSETKKHNELDYSMDHSEFNLAKFITMILALGLLGWIIEAFVTAFIVNYIKQLRPDIIECDTNSFLK